MLAVAEGVDTLLGAGLLLVATGAAEGRIEAVLVERLLEALGLHHVGVLRAAMGEGVDVLGDAFRIDVGDQVQAHLGDHLVAELVHLLELPPGVDVHDRERQLAGEERLARQVQHHGGVFTDGVEHHRVVEFGGHFTNDVDALRLQLFQVRQFIEHGYSRRSF
ncbi:hypothetical protein D3C72_1456610 [compost metagenome]